MKGHCGEVLLKRGKVALNRAVSPGKNKPYVPGYVSHGKEAGLCSEYSGKPGKGAQALCPILQVRKFPKVGNISVNCSAHFSAFPFSPKIDPEGGLQHICFFGGLDFNSTRNTNQAKLRAWTLSLTAQVHILTLLFPLHLEASHFTGSPFPHCRWEC